jgi:hypothetical protein
MDKKEEQKPIKKKRILFGLHLPIVGLHFLQDVVYTNVVEGKINYSLTTAFVEGLRLLQEKNPDIPERESLERRYNRGGKRRMKGEVYQTSFASTLEDKNWIENYIVYKLKENLFFSKILFINDVIEELKENYKERLLTIPNRKI